MKSQKASQDGKSGSEVEWDGLGCIFDTFMKINFLANISYGTCGPVVNALAHVPLDSMNA